MNVYTFSEARQKLATVLDEAQRKGAVRIKRRDGSEFEVAPVRSQASPLDVQGVDLGLSAEEIVSAVPGDARERGQIDRELDARLHKRGRAGARPPYQEVWISGVGLLSRRSRRFRAAGVAGRRLDRLP